MRGYEFLPYTTYQRSLAVYDFATVHKIVNDATVLQVSFVPSADEPFPTTLPMIGKMASFPSPNADPNTEALDIYLHGYVSVRMMRLAKDSTGHEEGLPVCVSATHVDGLVLALTPFHHSMNYRSAVLHGYAIPVEDLDEKVFAMELITEGVLKGRWQHSRVPPNKTELQSTSILKVRVVSASGKVRQGGPHDDRKDIKDEAVTSKVWTGIVPVWEAWGEPIAAQDNAVARLPSYLEMETEAVNRERKEYAIKAAKFEE